MKVLSSPERLGDMDAIILPGVGNFKAASQNIQPFRSTILCLVREGALLFGICLGLQLLFEESEESPGSGLELLQGRVLRLPQKVKTPHMGWNTLRICRENELLEGISEEAYFYFVHSYHANPVNEEAIVARTDYGVSFASVISYRNIYGTQFHPEKSGESGARILENLVRIIKK